MAHTKADLKKRGLSDFEIDKVMREKAADERESLIEQIEANIAYNATSPLDRAAAEAAYREDVGEPGVVFYLPVNRADRLTSKGKPYTVRGMRETAEVRFMPWDSTALGQNRWATLMIGKGAIFTHITLEKEVIFDLTERSKTPGAMVGFGQNYDTIKQQIAQAKSMIAKDEEIASLKRQIAANAVIPKEDKGEESLKKEAQKAK